MRARRLTSLGAGTAAVALAAASAWASPPHPLLQVRPSVSEEDQPVAIVLTGLRPTQEVTLALRSTDASGVVFSSRASYRADRRGRIDLARIAPLSGGSYTTAWSSGLVASMKATTGSPFAYYLWGRHTQAFRLAANSNGKTIASTIFQRRWSNAAYGETKLTLAKDGIDGTFYSPPRAHDDAAVLAFGGSEGGDNGTFASRFAAHGIPVLFVGYFHAPGLPDKLVNIPLEYFAKALQWLDRQPQVDPNRVSIFSGSYGSEAALLLGVHYPKLVHGIVATVPSSVVTCGIIGADRATVNSKYCLGSPWTLDGKPLPYTKLLNQPNPWDTPSAVIPVEQITAPVLLACAGEDNVWSSCPYAQAIVKRRASHGLKTTLFTYPRASHYVGSPESAYEPGLMQQDISTPWSELGREDLWPRVISFVRNPR